MTALTRFPVNPNFLHPNKFQLAFSRIPNVQFFGQVVNVPGVSLVEIPKYNPFVELYSPGEKIVYDVLNVTFLVDEDMVTWKSIHDWIRAMTFPHDFSEYRNLVNTGNPIGIPNPKFPQFSDATLTLLSSANEPNFRFSFVDIFPTNLSTFSVSSADDPNNTITCDATFRYSWFDVTKI